MMNMKTGWLGPKRKFEQQMNDELRFHLEKQVAANIGAGMTPDEAQRQARLQLGALEGVKVGCREERRGFWLESLWSDVRYAIRILRKSPGFTIVAVLTLALGIGANTAIFSVIERVLLRSLPYEHPEQLIEIWNTYLPAVPLGGLSPGDFYDWRRQAKTVSEMAAYSWNRKEGANLTGDGAAQRVSLDHATSNLFSMLGEEPIAGHFFVPEDDRPGCPPVVVLSHRFWESRFGGDPAVVGRTITLDGSHYTVTGVLPGNSSFLDLPDIWMPMGLYPDSPNDHNYHEWVGLARLEPGATIAQARAEFELFNRRSAVAYPAQHKGFGVAVRRMQTASAIAMRQGLLVLFAAVGLVLLIACVNVANLLLARNAAREKELALRIALGASRGRLVIQLLTESVLLAFMGGALGIAVAIASVKIFGTLAPQALTTLRQTSVDGIVLLFTAAICMLAGIVCGLLPVLQTRGTDLNIALKQGTKGTAALTGRRLHRFLVVAEIALALVPLAGAGLLLRSLSDLMNVSPGFRPGHLLSMYVPQAAIPAAQSNKMTLAEWTKVAQRQSLEFQQIADRLDSLPGVKSAAGIDVLPLASQIQQATRFVIEGRPIPDEGIRPLAEMRTVTPGYFSTMRIPLLSGRTVNPEDYAANLDINEAMQQRFWPKGDAIGKRINLCSLAPKPCWWMIVGVVGNVHQFGLDAPPTYDVYFSGGWTPYLLIRTALDPQRISLAAIAAIHRVDPSLPVTNVVAMDNVLSQSIGARRFSAVLTGVFAALALVLAAVGIYGVMGYMVGKRTNEVGIRMALGAQRKDVLRLLMREGALLSGTGILIGIVGSLALSQLLRGLLFDVKPMDPATFTAVALALFAVAMLACFVPARRAMRVDPVSALRCE
jgi:predicted permease